MLYFLVVYSITFIALTYRLVRDRSTDALFAPWPGYAFTASSYFLASSLAFDGYISDTQWILYSLAAAGFFVGSLLVKIFFPFPVRQSSVADIHLDSHVFRGTLSFPAMFFLLAIALICTGYMMARSGPPIFAANVDAARVAYLENGYLGELAAMLDVVAVFCVAYLICNSRKGWDAKAVFCITVVILFLIVAGLAGSRSRLLKVAVPAVFVYHFFKGGISFRSLFVNLVLGSAFIGLLGYFRNLSRYGQSLAQGIGSQAMDWGATEYALYYLKKELANGAFGLSEVLYYIPAYAHFQYGQLHLAPFLNPIGIRMPNPGDFFKDLMGGTWDGFGLAATFIAPMYADFGILGVFGLSVVYAILFSYVYRMTKVPSPVSTYWACVYAMLFYVMISGIRSDMVSFESIWFCLLAIFLRIVSYRDQTVMELIRSRKVSESSANRNRLPPLSRWH